MLKMYEKNDFFPVNLIINNWSREKDSNASNRKFIELFYKGKIVVILFKSIVFCIYVNSKALIHFSFFLIIYLIIM